MRYHYEEKDTATVVKHAKIYFCDHPVYYACSLYTMSRRGLAVIQQYFIPEGRYTKWGPIKSDSLANDIFMNERFYEYMQENAKVPDESGLYPTVTVRQLMWALRMKPLPKERWETTFDRSRI